MIILFGSRRVGWLVAGLAWHDLGTTRVNFNKRTTRKNKIYCILKTTTKKLYCCVCINTMTPTVWRIMKFAFFI